MLDIKRVSIDQVELWEKNPRNIKKKDFERLKAQIEKLGIYKPMIAVEEDGKYIILGGNMRLLACKELGHKEVEISIVTAKTEAERIEIALSDNDRAGEYDDQTLAELIYNAKDGIDTQMFKIDVTRPISIEELLTHYGPKIEGGDEDQVPAEQPDPVSKLGDLYELGPHRILCGDATNQDDYKRLLQGREADIIFTDPPYNVAYQGGETDKFGPILGDNQSEEQFVKFTLAFFERFRENIKPGGVFYVCSGYTSYPIFVYAIRACGLVFSTPIIWVKNNTSLGWGDYRKKHEMVLKVKKGRKKAQPILYGWNRGKHYFIEHRFEADVWEIARRGSQSMLHPTQKPLGLIQRALRNSSKPNELVLDPFAGSGSTLIAAERETRVCCAMELDPRFIDVMIRRYAALGGATEEEIRATVQRPQDQAKLEQKSAPKKSTAPKKKKGTGAKGRIEGKRPKPEGRPPVPTAPPPGRARGYQPDKGSLDPENPPTGGSGVPPK